MAAQKTKRKSAGKKTTKKAAAPSKKRTSAPSKALKAKASPKKPAYAKASAGKKKSEKSDGYILAQAVVDGILEKKGENITWLDLRDIENSVCEFFIICEGNSKIQVEAIADSVEEIVKKETGQKPYHTEGKQNSLWILIDYINVLVHVFQREARQFYNLESLWADAEVVKPGIRKRA